MSKHYLEAFAANVRKNTEEQMRLNLEAFQEHMRTHDDVTYTVDNVIEAVLQHQLRMMVEDNMDKPRLYILATHRDVYNVLCNLLQRFPSLDVTIGVHVDEKLGKTAFFVKPVPINATGFGPIYWQPLSHFGVAL